MPAQPRRNPVTLAALTSAVVIAAAAGAAVTAASTAASAATTTTATTATTTVSPGLPGGTVVQRWDFDSGSTQGWTPVSGAALSTSAAAAKSGAGGLLLSNAGTFGAGASVTFDASSLQDYVWYEAGLALRLPAGTPTYRFQGSIGGTSGLASPVTSTAWGSAGVHFRKLPGQSTLTLRVNSTHSCPADPPAPAATTYADEGRITVSNTQAAITYTTFPCPPVTTTSTTTTTGGGGAPVPGTVVASWGFEDGSLTGFSGLSGASLAIGSTAKSGTRGLTVSGGGTGGLSLSADSSRLVQEGLYELNVPVYLPAGSNQTRYVITAGGQSSFVQVTPGQWTNVPVRFVWRGAASLVASLTPNVACPAYDPSPAPQFSVDDVVLRAAPADGGGNIGAPACPQPSSTTTSSTTTTTAAAPRCRVDYRIVSQWPGGFQSNAVLTNTSSSPLTNWTLTLTFGDGQKITQAWSVTAWSQTGPDVWFTAPSWATNLAPGASTYVGMMGTWSGWNNPPTRILVNGQPCDGQQPTTTTTTTTTRPATTTTRTVAREDCRWVMAVPGATTGTIQPDPVSQITIWGYGLGGMYSDGTITWGSDTSVVTGLTGVTGWSQTGRVVSFSGLQWTGYDPKQVTLQISGTAISQLPTSVKVNVVSCGYGLS